MITHVATCTLNYYPPRTTFSFVYSLLHILLVGCMFVCPFNCLGNSVGERVQPSIKPRTGCCHCAHCGGKDIGEDAFATERGAERRSGKTPDVPPDDDCCPCVCRGALVESAGSRFSVFPAFDDAIHCPLEVGVAAEQLLAAGYFSGDTCGAPDGGISLAGFGRALRVRIESLLI